MAYPKKVADSELLATYGQLQSVWKTAHVLGICGQSVHERLVKLGACNGKNYWTEDDARILSENYAVYADAGRLQVLAEQLGRTRHFVCRKARELGLTNRLRVRTNLSVWKHLEKSTLSAHWERFKASPLGLSAYCKKNGYDDLGFSKCMKLAFPDEWEHVIELKASDQSWYKYGRQFEYRCRDHLVKHGFYVVRSAASRTPIDLTAIRIGCVALVQCKRNGILRPSDWNALFDLAKSIGALPILASTPTGRGILYQELIDRKEGRKAQPFKPWSPEIQAELL